MTLHSMPAQGRRAGRRFPLGQAALHLAFLIACLTYILPFLLMVSISLSDESRLIKEGYSILPKGFNTLAYQLALKNSGQIVDGYLVTFTSSMVNTACSLFVQLMAAYALSRSNFTYRRACTIIFFITMLFGGGMVPSYVINTKYLGLKDNFWIYVLPGIVSAWNIFVFRTQIKQLPEGLIEAGKIDGASELRICFQIVMPLTVPVLATFAFMDFVGCWNQWSTTMIYIKNPKLYTLQYLLQRILAEQNFLKAMMEEGTLQDASVIPTEALTYAMAIIASGPVLVIFPLFQKYFVKGLTIGSIKG